jgi:hypothetical protein
MTLMLQTGRMDSATVHLNKAMELCDEAHSMEFPDD